MKYSILVLSIGLLFGCSSDDAPIISPPDNFETTIQYKSNAGVDANLNSLDIYYTSSEEKRPVVIWVHGGAWAIGDKNNKMNNKINLLRDQEGYVLVSVNYRLSPFPYELNNPNRVMFPTHNADVADAIKWVYDNIADYGGDKEQIALMGHSAGAHLVSLTATSQVFLEDVGMSVSDIKGVAAIDTEGYDIVDELLPANRENFHVNAFGTDSNIHAEASPIHHISVFLNHPQFFVAKRGTANRIAKADAFIAKLEDNLVTVTQIDGSEYDHEGINDAIGDPNDTVITPGLVEFFREVFN